MTETAKRERGQGRIFLRGKVYWIQFQDGRGNQKRESAETDNPKVATKKLNKAIGEVAANIRPDNSRIAYEDLRESFYRDYEINGRKSLRRDANGKARMDKIVRLDSFFEGFLASDITTELVKKFIAGEQARGLAAGSINRSTSALRRMHSIAKQDGRLRHVPYFPMLKESKPRQGFVERDQYQTLSKCLPDYMKVPLALGFFTAMRLGEVLALTWDQVNFLDGLISLRTGETKNDAPRTIPIVPQLMVQLREQFAKRSPDFPHVCFRVERNGKPARIKGFRRAWQSGCIRAQLGRMVERTDSNANVVYAKPRGPRSKPKVATVYEGLIFHDLRRSAVRSLVRAGVSQKVARDISGHKTNSVFDRYNISSQQDVIEAGKRLANFHGEKFGDNSGTISTSTHEVAALKN